MNFAKSLFLLFILLCSSLFAEYENIKNIVVEGNVNVSKDLIDNSLNFKEGDIYSAENISLSIKSLYKLGLFSDIYISKEEIDADNMNIIVHVSENPFIANMKISGNKKISKKQIKNKIKMEEIRCWSQIIEKDLTSKIKELYLEKGYNFVDISYKKNELSNGKIDIEIVLDEGAKVKISQIEIYGNKAISSKKIKSQMKTKKAGFFRAGKYDEKVFLEDLGKIVSYYTKKGYLDVQIKSYEVSPIKNENNIKVEIYLDEGEIYYFGKVEVEGNSFFDKQRIISCFMFKKEDVFDNGKFEEALNQVRLMYYNQGYIYSNINYALKKISNDKNLIDVMLTIEENNRAKIRKININGNKKTKEKIIRRKLYIAPGDYYSQAKLSSSIRSIYNTGFFKPEIIPSHKVINDSGDIDLNISLEDKSSASINGSVGVNSGTGVFGALSLNFNNLFGNSWKTSIEAEFGTSYNKYSYSFTNPYLFDTDILTGFSFEWKDNEYSDYDLFKRGFSMYLGTSVDFIDYSSVKLAYSLYTNKYNITDSSDVDATSLLWEYDAEGWQLTSSMSFTFYRDSRDNVFFPTGGSEITLYSEIAGGILGGDEAYFKQIGQVSFYNKLLGPFALRTKWRAGYVTSIKSGKDVPPNERFYVGGVGSNGLRGYSDMSISPNDDGGERSIIFSNEIGVPLGSDQIVGIFFFDAGECYNDFADFNFADLKKGTGLGVRLITPIGLLGVDYAYNIDEDTWEFHFPFGITF